ncbi:MAG TPA: PEGA domain-containing protein [Vicinamibacteria bacterium]
MSRLRSVLVLSFVLASALARAQSAQEAAQREIQAAQDQLARAVLEFDGTQQSRSIVLFDEIITRLDAVNRQGALTTQGRDLLAQSYELRGRAYYNIGLQEKASENFRLLVQLKPDYAISKEKVSPKIVDLYNSVKKLLVGYVAVSSRPAAARVTLVGPGEARQELGLTDFFPLEVLAGDYTVEVAKDGYKTDTRHLSLAAKATESLEFELVRTLASAFFITEPAGVEVWIDGEHKVTTAGNLAPDLSEGARAKGLDPSRASARVEVSNLSLSTHTIEFRRKCYETVKRTLETSLAQDYEADPVRLEDSLASLRLVSDPPGAKIFLNGEAKGVTPAEIEGLCSGKMRVEVKHAAGKFIKDLVLGKDEAVSLDCPIRPTLAFLGVVADTPAGERNLADAEERLRENLARMSSLNFIPAPRETVDRILEQERVTRKGLVPGGGTDADLVRKVTEKLASSLDVQGFLVAVLPEERLQRTANLNLLAAGNIVADPWPVTFAEAASYGPFLARLDQKVTSYRPWSGLITVDTQLFPDGVPVLRVVSGSPAAEAGVQPGELVTAADGKPVARTTDLLAAVAGKKPKEKLALHLKGSGGPRAVELTLGQTPQEIPLYDPSLLYNKVMMDLRAQVEGYPGTEQAAFAGLNLAIAAMHFQDYAAAHDYLMKVKSELPTRPGVSQGTAFYYLGLALEKLSYKTQAVEAYRQAAGFKDATLINNDGPAVAPLAARRGGS